MKWILIILGVLVGIVALVAIVGAMLPKGHQASRAAKYAKTPQEVWAAITDFANSPSWRKGLKSMERLEDSNGHPVWRETSNFGPVTYEIIEFDPPKRMATQIVDENLPFGGTWTYEITPSDSASILTITENGEIYNPFFRFMAKFIFGYHATMEAYLKSLGQKFGQEITLLETTQ